MEGEGKEREERREKEGRSIEGKRYIAVDWCANKVQKAISVCHQLPSSLFLRYTDIDAFAQDARLVFSNCAFYNEDDSEVCCHGDNLKSHLF